MSFRSPFFVVSLLLGFSLSVSVMQSAQAVWGSTQAVVGQSLGTPGKPQLVDLNRDGLDDLVYAQALANESDRSRLFVQLNDGTGQFADRLLIGETISESVRVDEIVFADFEGDGDLDVFDLRAGTVALNSGSGHFGPFLSFGVDGLRPSLAVFGEETKVTVFGFTKEEPRQFQGYQVDDAGVLVRLWDVSLPEFASLDALLLSGPQDFNGNGQPELRYLLDGGQWLLERTSATTFVARMLEGADGIEFFVDINEDQVVDGLSIDEQKLVARLNDGSGVFGDVTVLSSSTDEPYEELRVADGDGDEVEDLLLFNDAGFRWAFKDVDAVEPTYSLGPIVFYPNAEEEPTSDLAVGQASGDLFADIVVARPRVPTFPLGFIADAGVTEMEPELIDVPHIGLGGPLNAIVADVDADERPDIVFTSQGRGEIRWCRQLETGDFGDPMTVGPATSSMTRHGLQAHDFNLDGFPDILHQSGSQEAFVYQNEGDGTFTPVPIGDFGTPDGEDEPLYGFTAGDVSGDGRVDLIVSGQWGVGAYFNTSIGGVMRFSARNRVPSSVERAGNLTTLHYDGINPVFVGSGSGSLVTYAFTGAAFVERVRDVPQATGFLETASTDDGLGLPHVVYPSPEGLSVFERARNSEIASVAQVPTIEEAFIADVDNDQDRDLVGILPPSTIGVRRSTVGEPYSQNLPVVPDIASDLVRVSVGDVNGDSLNDLLVCAEDQIVWMQGLSPEIRIDANDNLFPDPWEAALSEADAALGETELLRLYGFDRGIPTIALTDTSNLNEVTFQRRISDHRLRYAVETSNDLVEWTVVWESHQLADGESTSIGATTGDFQTTTARWRSFEPNAFARVRVQFAE